MKTRYRKLESEMTPFESARPRYLVLAESLSNAIRSGEYPVGTLLPTESELCDKFDVSRHTIREAIRKLRDLGLVSRHQGVGTRVENNDISGRFVLSLGSIPDIWQYVQTTRFDIYRKEVISASQALIPLPPIGAGEEWLRLDGLRFVAGQDLPISHSSVHVNGAFRGIKEQVGQKQVPVFSFIERRYGVKVVTIKQEIGAILVAPAVAKLLKIKSGSPALSIIRHYLTADAVVVQVGCSITPSERFTYRMDLNFEYPLNKQR